MTTIAPNIASAALKALFDRQMATLQTAGLASEAELKPLFPLLEKIGKTPEGEGRIPFVIVIQNPNLTLTERMAKVVLGGKSGASYLSDSRVTNLDNQPPKHYLAVDVEDGRAMQNIKPSVCLQMFKRDRRFGGTVIEGVMTVTYQPEILRHHYIDLPGSRCDSVNAPYLAVCDEGPRLCAFWRDFADPDVGSLSCGSRLELGA